jgi:predicted ATP-dependent serine protease
VTDTVLKILELMLPKNDMQQCTNCAYYTGKGEGVCLHCLSWSEFKLNFEAYKSRVREYD